MTSRLLAAVVGAVFLWSGSSKATGFGQWRADARAQGLWPLVTYVLPTLELVLGGCLLVLEPNTVVLGVATVLLLVFTTYLAVMVLTGSKVPCACFGARFSRPPSWRHVLRNLALIAVLVLAAANV